MSDEEDVMSVCWEGSGGQGNYARTLGHQHHAAHAQINTDSGATGSTSCPKGSLDILLMLSDANDLPNSTGLRREHRVRLSQEITYQWQLLSFIPVTAVQPQE